jgi:hypothetical protein
MARAPAGTRKIGFNLGHWLDSTRPTRPHKRAGSAPTLGSGAGYHATNKLFAPDPIAWKSNLQKIA